MKYLNLSGIHTAEVKEDPFPYFVINNFILEPYLNVLLNLYPYVPGSGSYPCKLLNIHPIFQNLLDELYSQELKDILASKFTINLHKKPVMITARGYCQRKDGKIHLDNRHKLLTLLLYMNPTWPSPDGRLRLLHNDHDLETPALEIAPLAGTLVVFKTTKNAWHGHTSFEGPRKVLQINYIDSGLIVLKETIRHRIASIIKKFYKN